MCVLLLVFVAGRAAGGRRARRVDGTSDTEGSLGTSKNSGFAKAQQNIETCKDLLRRGSLLRKRIENSI